jgi:hypothetical protein
MAPYSLCTVIEDDQFSVQENLTTTAHALAYGSTLRLRIIIKLRTKEFVLDVYAN